MAPYPPDLRLRESLHIPRMFSFTCPVISPMCDPTPNQAPRGALAVPLPVARCPGCRWSREPGCPGARSSEVPLPGCVGSSHCALCHRGSSRARSTPRPRRASGRCDGERCGVCLCLSAVVVYAVYRYIPDHSPEYHAHTHGKTYGIISWMHCRFTRHGTRVQGVRFDGGAHGLPRLHVNARAPPPRLSHPGAVQMGASGGGTARIMVLGLSQAFACRAAARLLIATCLSTSADDVSRHLLDCPPPSPPRHTCMQHTWSIESHHSRT